MAIIDLPMAGKICLVTGATAGIGEATASGLASLGATVILAGRNIERCSASVERIKQWTRNPEIAYLVADLSSQREVRRLADELGGLSTMRQASAYSGLSFDPFPFE